MTLGYEFHFTRPGDEEQNTIPYARLAAGLAYYDYDVSGPGTRARSSRLAAGGGRTATTCVSRPVRGDVELPSGLRFSLTYGFIRI